VTWHAAVSKGTGQQYAITVNEAGEYIHYETNALSGGTCGALNTAGSTATHGAWHRVVATYDGANKKVYIDGIERATAACTWNFADNTQALDIGWDGDNEEFNGVIDEVRVSNVARSLEWIGTEYNNQNSPSTFYTIGNGENGATWAASEDTVLPGLAKITPKRLRFEFSNEGTQVSGATTYLLEVSGPNPSSCSAGAFSAVPTVATGHWQIVDSVNLTDGSATSNSVGGLTDENTTFVAGEFKDTGNQTAGITLSTTEFTEVEYSIQATANAVAGASYCFRLTNAGSITNFTYNQYAQATVDGVNNFLVEAAGGGNIATQTAGSPFNIQLTARDNLNNTVTSFNGTADITSTGSLSAGGGATVAFTNGVLSSHSVTISNTGSSFTITATETSATANGTSNNFTVDPGAPTQLGFSVEPVNATATVIIAPAIKVQVQDSQGNLVPTATDSITLAINSNPGSGTLSGTLVVAAVSGEATFSDISIDKVGTGCAHGQCGRSDSSHVSEF